MDVRELVESDLLEGLAGSFSPVPPAGQPDTAAIRLLEPFDRVQEPITNGVFTAFPWSYQARHTGPAFGLRETGQEVVIYGCTLVDVTSTPPQFSRFIEWSTVMAELGMTGGKAVTP